MRKGGRETRKEKNVGAGALGGMITGIWKKAFTLGCMFVKAEAKDEVRE